jgi:Papain-like cysteine protease AvrRpt2
MKSSTAGFILVFGVVISQVAATARCQTVDYTVPGTVVVLKQDGNTCWATTATMLLSWKSQSSMTIESVCAKAGPEFTQLYNNRQALPPEMKNGFLKGCGLVAIPPSSYTVSGFLDLLETHGALWVTVDSADAAMTHAVLVTGINGDGSLDGTNVNFANPADGKSESLSFREFETRFENAAGLADIQLVYAP